MFRGGTERRPQRVPQGFKPRYAVVQPESPSPHRRWAVPRARGRACVEGGLHYESNDDGQNYPKQDLALKRPHTRDTRFLLLCVPHTGDGPTASDYFNSPCTAATL